MEWEEAKKITIKKKKKLWEKCEAFDLNTERPGKHLMNYNLRF